MAADPITTWNPSLPSPADPHRATIMDGIKLGLGMALAWMVIVPVILLALFVLLGGIVS